MALTLPNCRAPGDYVVGSTSICNIATDCNWCERNQLSFDFLCCETGKYIGPHFTNPLMIYLMTNDVVWTAFLATFFEVVETMLPTIFGRNDFAFADANDLETHAASLIGDVLIQGGSGLLFGWLIRSVFRVPTLISTPERARAYNLRGRRIMYIVLFIVYMSSFWFAGTVSGHHNTRIGLILQTLVQIIFIAVIWPVVLSSDERDRQMIWRRKGNDYFSGTEKTLFFFTWGITVIILHSIHFPNDNHQPWFTFNEWYEQWFFSLPWLFVWMCVAFAVAYSRRDWYTVWAIVGALFAAVSFGMMFGNSIFNMSSTGLLVGGVILLVGAIVFWLIATLSYWDGTPAVEWTREHSRTINEDYRKREATPILPETELHMKPDVATLTHRKPHLTNASNIKW